MKNWSPIITIGLVLFAIVLFGGGWGMMGPGMMGWGFGPSMMWGFAPLGWLGMLLAWLWPIILFVLILLAIWWLIRSTPPPTIGWTCPHCGRGVSPESVYCPHCGQPNHF